MPGEIKFIKGSALEVNFKLSDPLETPTAAKMVVKNDLDDTDAEAVLTLEITQASSTQGVIDVSGAKPVLRFIFTEAMTDLLEVGARLFSAVKMEGDSGIAWSPEGARRAVRVLPVGVESV